MKTEAQAEGDSGLADELARIEQIINSPEMRDVRRHRQGNGRVLRPRNAATIIVVDDEGKEPKILMGRRNRSLTFMPGALVFPGGSVDRADATAPAADNLHPGTEARIVANMRGRPSARRAHALGMAAIRELAEESGLLIGRKGEVDSAHPASSHPDWQDFRDANVVPAIGGLVLFARAITPPGPPRRFDTWFFAARASEIAHRPEGGFRPSGELEALQWMTPGEAIGGPTREITRVMLVELMRRMKRDPTLDPSHPAPFYRALRGQFHREIM